LKAFFLQLNNHPMNKCYSLFAFILMISMVSFGSAKITTGDYAKLHPGLQKNTGNLGQIIGNSLKSLSSGATVTYVGKFNCNDGQYWMENPPCYTGQEAAALLFGGNPEDYFTSTNTDTVNAGTITFTCWCCGWGTGQVEKPQDYKVDVAPAGYEYPEGGDNAVSAYINDWPITGDTYVWRTSNPVPVPIWTIVLVFSVVGIVVAVRFRRRLSKSF
jgi:hypothetical protein